MYFFINFSDVTKTSKNYISDVIEIKEKINTESRTNIQYQRREQKNSYKKIVERIAELREIDTEEAKEDLDGYMTRIKGSRSSNVSRIQRGVTTALAATCDYMKEFYGINIELEINKQLFSKRRFQADCFFLGWIYDADGTDHLKEESKKNDALKYKMSKNKGYHVCVVGPAGVENNGEDEFIQAPPNRCNNKVRKAVIHSALTRMRECSLLTADELRLDILTDVIYEYMLSDIKYRTEFFLTEKESKSFEIATKSTEKDKEREEQRTVI